jgi:predicted PurR-regulated permease PerM
MASPPERAGGEGLTLPGPLLRSAGNYAWRILVVGAVVYFAWRLISHVALVVVPFVISLLLAALLAPLVSALRRRGLERGVSTLMILVGVLLVMGGLLTLVVVRSAQQAPQIGAEVNRLIPHLKHWLVHGPLHLNSATVSHLSQTLTKAVTKNSSAIASTALSTGRTALEVLGGLALTVFSTVFLLYDGDRIWAFVVKGVPLAVRARADAAARAAWRTLSLYTRGTLIVASFHGVAIVITLTILGVPLAVPLAVLVALGSFIPLVGAVVTGAIAAGVAALSKGLLAGVIVVAVLVADSQIEGHALQPFVVGRYVRVHPLAVVLALATGGLLFGIFGSFIAVPLVACVKSAVQVLVASEEVQSTELGEIQPEVDAGGGPTP